MQYIISTLKKCVASIKPYARQAVRYVKTHRRNSVIALAVAIFALALVLRWLGGGEAPVTQKALREVQVSTVADLMNGTSGLSVVGTVQSKSEAKISPETGGRIVRVNASLGQNVGAGAILAEIENASQRAAVLQAEGAFDAAKASVPNIGSGLENAKGSAVTTLLGAYAAVNSAVEDAVGRTMTNPELSQGSFAVSSRDTQALLTINASQARMQAIVLREDGASNTLTASSGLMAELNMTEGELREVRTYLDAVLRALNAGVPRDDVSVSTIAGYVAAVTSARTGVNTSLASIVSARTALETATQNAVGGSSAVSASSATLKQAEGAYNAALAALEKTRIRAPISGTLNNFTLKLGDTVSPGQQVAVVSNNGALEIVAFVTETDRTRIAVGSTVGIEGGLTGTITRIAPALDPVTRKIEVRIGLPSSALKELTNGESVRVELKQATETKAATGPVRIPIAALKMGTEAANVFTVDAESKIVVVPVTIGKLSGKYVEIQAGLTADTEIVTDARGLKAGDEVSVAH